MKKEEFLFICGVEGSGHELFRTVLSEYLSGKSNIVNMVQRGAFSSASFPYSQPRDAYRRPNISHMVKNTPNDVSLKILALYRDPRFAVYSGFRRKVTNDILLQCKIVDINLKYIREELDKLDPKMYRIIRFEKFIENPHQYTEMLISFISVSKESLERGYEKIKTPNFSLHDQKEVLNKFFKDKDINDYGFHDLYLRTRKVE